MRQVYRSVEQECRGAHPENSREMKRGQAEPDATDGEGQETSRLRRMRRAWESKPVG